MGEIRLDFNNAQSLEFGGRCLGEVATDGKRYHSSVFLSERPERLILVEGSISPHTFLGSFSSPEALAGKLGFSKASKDFYTAMDWDFCSPEVTNVENIRLRRKSLVGEFNTNPKVSWAIKNDPFLSGIIDQLRACGVPQPTSIVTTPIGTIIGHDVLLEFRWEERQSIGYGSGPYVEVIHDTIDQMWSLTSNYTGSKKDYKDGKSVAELFEFGRPKERAEFFAKRCFRNT